MITLTFLFMLFFVRLEIAEMDYPSDFGGTLRLTANWFESEFGRRDRRLREETSEEPGDAKSSDPVSIERDRWGEKEKDGETPSESSPAAKTRPGLRIFARTHTDGHHYAITHLHGRIYSRLSLRPRPRFCHCTICVLNSLPFKSFQITVAATLFFRLARTRESNTARCEKTLTFFWQSIPIEQYCGNILCNITIILIIVLQYSVMYGFFSSLNHLLMHPEI